MPTSDSVKINEADKVLETAMAEVKEAIKEIEVVVEKAPPTPSRKAAVKELETAITDMKQAVTKDEEGFKEAKKIIANAESELETAMTDIKTDVDPIQRVRLSQWLPQVNLKWHQLLILE